MISPDAYSNRLRAGKNSKTRSVNTSKRTALRRIVTGSPRLEANVPARSDPTGIAPKKIKV